VDQIDTSVAHPARRYNYWLGGKDHFAADRESGDLLARAFPTARIAALENRDFLRRGVRFLAEAGVRQFLDIGTGLPVPDNTHEIAQRIAPESRIVYVDNDPVVLAHARALLTSSSEGRTDYIDADLRRPDDILEQAAKTLDFNEPIALLLVAILHFVEAEEAYPLVRELVDVLPSGSHLVLSHLTDEMHPIPTRAVQRTYTERGFTFVFRTKDEVERFFTETPGITLDEPGVVPAHQWHPGPAPAPPTVDQAYFESLDDIEKITYRDINDVTDDDINVYGATGKKA
jgi:hypothetical protein